MTRTGMRGLLALAAAGAALLVLALLNSDRGSQVELSTARTESPVVTEAHSIHDDNAPATNAQRIGAPELEEPADSQLEAPAVEIPVRWFFGRVLDASSGEPVEGAEVFTRRTTGFTPDTANTLETHSDLDGGFAIAIEGWSRKSVRIVSRDFLPFEFSTDHDHLAREHPREVELDRPATLAVTVHRPNSQHPRDAVVRVALAEPRAELPEALREARGTWGASIDGGGHARIGDLPSGLCLRASIGSGEYDAVEFALVSGETRTLHFWPASRASIEGRVEITKNEHISSRKMRLLRDDGKAVDQSEYAMMRPGVSPDFARDVPIDESGAFVIPDVSPGVWWLEPDISFSTSSNGVVSCGWIVSFARRIAVNPGDSRIQVEIGIPVSSYVSVHATDLNGASVAGHIDFAVRRDGHVIHTRMDGRSTNVGPLLAGRYTLVATSKSGSSNEVEFTMPQDELDVELHAHADLKGAVVDPLGSAQRPARVVAIPRDQFLEVVAAHAIEGDGAFAFRNLRPGVWDICARMGDGRVAVAPSLTVANGAVLADLQLHVEPRTRLLLRYTGSSSRELTYRIRRGAACVDTGELRREVREQAFAPPGELAAELYRGGTLVTSVAFALAAGERRVLDIALD